ncbi:MAG: PPC domain-containing protein, partial [Myxococcales bacterium]|nr:PPC domain-containing protein [Myxococcales bacterium]
TCCPNAAFCDDGSFCKVWTCNTDNQCIATNKANSTQCVAPTCVGNVPYTSSFCTNGVCPAPSIGSACDPTNPGLPLCTTSVCNPTFGACEQQYTVGAPCSTSTCSSGQVTSSSTCNASGQCVAGGQSTVPCPGNFACANGTSCRKTCTIDSHCQTNYICEGNQCIAKKANGVTCAASSQCTSGNCSNGVCCTSGQECCVDEAICSGNAGVPAAQRCIGCVSFACTQKPTSTKCRDAYCAGSGRVPDQYCSSGTCPAGSAVTCQGANVCIAYGCSNGVCTTPNATTGTPCGTKRCQGVNELVLAASCNGLGTCAEPTPTACPSNLRCNDAGTDCRPGCVIDSHCIGGYYCEANVCKAKKARGETCATAAQCATGYCNSGYCCDGGTCCKTDSNCTPPTTNGCTTATCSNSQCTSTVLTNKVCAGPQCSVSQVFTPESRCDAAGACMPTGVTSNCSTASTTCLLSQCSTSAPGCITVAATQGTSCGAPSCVGFELVPAKVCDGAGGCVANGTKTACAGNLTCVDATTCRTACTESSHCRGGYYCDLGTCSPLRPNGAPCTSATQCSANYCEGGICCSSGECCLAVSDCTAVGCKDASCSNNTCTYANNTAQCAAGSCGGANNMTFTSPKICAAGTCPVSTTQTGCSGANVCKQYWCDPVDGCLSANKAATTECAAASCTGTKLTTASRCDGAGLCVSGSTADCPNGYACSDTGTTCRTGCTLDSHCASTRICMGGACVAPLADGSTCTGNAQCLSGYCGNGLCCAPGGQCCSTSSQCGDGNACTDDACSAFVCAHTNNTKPCQAARCEGTVYVASKSCSGGACAAGGAMTECDLQTSCMTYECSQTEGCLAAPADQGLPCGDPSCSGTNYTPPAVCDGLGNCASSSPQACDDGNVCTGAETCDIQSGCVAGNPASAWICGDGICQTACETAASCQSDCTLSPGYTLSMAEFDAWNTGSAGATNRISKYGCNTLNYPGAEFAYRLTAPIAGTITVSLSGADASTDIIVLSGSSGDPGQCVGVGTGSGSARSFTATAGGSYVIVVDRRTAGTTPFTVYARYTSQCKGRLFESWDRNAYPRAWTGDGNWQTSQDSPFGVAHVKFSGSPTLTSFTRALVSPVIDIQGCTTLNVKLKWRFTEDTTTPAALPHPGVNFRVEWSPNGGTSWTNLLTYNTGLGPTPPQYKQENLPVTITGTPTQGRFRVVVAGDTSLYVNRFQVEDIDIGGP